MTWTLFPPTLPMPLGQRSYRFIISHLPPICQPQLAHSHIFNSGICVGHSIVSCSGVESAAAMRDWANSYHSRSISIATQSRPVSMQTSGICPLPHIGSNTRSPGLLVVSTMRRSSPGGFGVGCPFRSAGGNCQTLETLPGLLNV